MRPLIDLSKVLWILLAAIASHASLAQTAPPPYPSRAITVIVPFAAGGSVDSTARLISPKLAERLKQPVVIENVAGAAGTIGTYRAIRSQPDGYTLLFAVASPINVAPLVTPSLVKYDALKQLTPVAVAATSPFVLIGRPDLPAGNTSDLLKLARSQPGKLTYGTDGVGTSMHITAELVKQRAGIDVVHVPYRAGPQVLTELIGGHIDLAVMPVTLAQPFIKDGKVKAFGVTSQRRWASLPGVPSLAEDAELKGVDVDSWYGLLVPSGTDPTIVDRLAKEIAVVLSDPEVVQGMEAAGLRPTQMTPAQFSALLHKERQALAAVVSAAGIRAE